MNKFSTGRSGSHAAAVRRSKSSASRTKAEAVPTSLVNIQLEAQQVLEDSIAYHKFVQVKLELFSLIIRSSWFCS